MIVFLVYTQFHLLNYNGQYMYLTKVHLKIDSCESTLLLYNSQLQGGALNRGLLFADPPPSLLGAVSGNISEIR
jgi:hypothetical protein